MRACQRGSAPELLERHGPAVAQDYVAKRRADPSYGFKWPTRGGQSLYAVTRAALDEMTDGRCAYCDGHPIAAMGEAQIDHFRPKSREEFCDLVCTWENLFLICVACNKSKMDQWDEALLRPDEPGFDFTRYFSYRTDTGSLEPNAAASAHEQHRARRTIEILDLNRAGACTFRRNTVRSMLNATAEDLADLGYRYLIPLCLQ